jgi:K+-sensing histidine kinase KdpD
VVAGVLQGLALNLASQKIRVENSVPDTLPTLTVDRQKFTRLFELLLKDEIVSLPAGSTVALSASAANPMEIEVQIRDNGPGLPKEALRSLFDPFMARSDSPMEYGINLMACYFIVHHHGGSIRAEGEAGQGTTFVLRLPTNASQAFTTNESPDFLQKALLNERLWEKLASE